MGGFYRQKEAGTGKSREAKVDWLFQTYFYFMKKREVLALGLVICAAKEALIELA